MNAAGVMPRAGGEDLAVSAGEVRLHGHAEGSAGRDDAEQHACAVGTLPELEGVKQTHKRAHAR